MSPGLHIKMLATTTNSVEMKNLRNVGDCEDHFMTMQWAYLIFSEDKTRELYDQCRLEEVEDKLSRKKATGVIDLISGTLIEKRFS